MTALRLLVNKLLGASLIATKPRRALKLIYKLTKTTHCFSPRIKGASMYT
jgi:hypothetical protein